MKLVRGNEGERERERERGPNILSVFSASVHAFCTS